MTPLLGSPAGPLPGAVGRERRAAPRRNLFVSAQLDAELHQGGVRIRNLSERGAMIEGDTLPGPGVPITLNRNELTASGEVAWRAGSRCGVSFAQPIDVDDWIRGKPRRVPIHAGQLQADRIQAALRQGTPLAADPVADGGSDHIELRVAEELAFVRRMLELAGDELSDSPAAIQRNMEPLQRLDLACQLLDELRKLIVAPDKPQAVAAIGIGELKARLTRKPLFG